MVYLSKDRPTREKWEIRLGFLCGIVGVALAAWAFWIAGNANHRASEAQGELRTYVRTQTASAKQQSASASLNSYLGCKRANSQIRPGARITTLVLADLIDSVNQAPRTSTLPDSFANAPRRLRRALDLLADQPCERLYADGFQAYRAAHPDQTP